MTGAFYLRPARERDAPEILSCLRAGFLPVKVHYSSEAWRRTVLDEEDVLRRLRTMRLWVAEAPRPSGWSGGVGDSEADGVVGTLAWYTMPDREGHLRGMAVVPSWEGRGVGRALMATAEADLHASGCDRVTLRTTRVLVRAIAFYTRAGYLPTGRAFEWHGVEAVEYEKRLLPRLLA